MPLLFLLFLIVFLFILFPSVHQHQGDTVLLLLLLADVILRLKSTMLLFIINLLQFKGILIPRDLAKVIVTDLDPICIFFTYAITSIRTRVFDRFLIASI